MFGLMSTPDHSHLDSLGLSPDGSELWIDYSDWQEQHTTLKLRYIISLAAQPRLVTDGSERHIGFREIPKHLISEAEAWLVSSAAVARTQHRNTLAMTLTQHLEHLRGHANDT